MGSLIAMLVYKIMDQNIQILNKTVVIAKFYNITLLILADEYAVTDITRRRQ